jgi:hypothetical protein
MSQTLVACPAFTRNKLFRWTASVEKTNKLLSRRRRARGEGICPGYPLLFTCKGSRGLQGWRVQWQRRGGWVRWERKSVLGDWDRSMWIKMQRKQPRTIPAAIIRAWEKRTRQEAKEFVSANSRVGGWNGRRNLSWQIPGRAGAMAQINGRYSKWNMGKGGLKYPVFP